MLKRSEVKLAFPLDQVNNVGGGDGGEAPLISNTPIWLDLVRLVYSDGGVEEAKRTPLHALT